jgi:hypothetical protein
MKKVSVFVVVLLLFASLVYAQTVVERSSFSNMQGWRAGGGDWVTSGGRLVQRDPMVPLARIDKRVDARGVYQIDFDIRYVDGGYASEQDLRNGYYHAGFGVHVGVANPPLGRQAWGNGESYLLWLNLDTRPETRRNAPEHYGFRAQVYESVSHSQMDLWETASARRMFGSPVMSIDLMEALRNYGVNLSVNDLMKYLNRDVPVSIRVNTRTGEIGVKDPTAPIRFYFNVDPALIRGRYVSLRTNSLSASYDDFTVTQR